MHVSLWTRYALVTRIAYSGGAEQGLLENEQNNVDVQFEERKIQRNLTARPIKSTEQYFPVVLFCIMLYNVVITLEFVVKF